MLLGQLTHRLPERVSWLARKSPYLLKCAGSFCGATWLVKIMLLKIFKSIKKGILNLIERLRTQGLRTTLIWAYARGVPAITGIPIIKYSRITADIYVGPQFRVAGRRRLESIGIVGSINLRDEYDDRAHELDLKEHFYIPTVDDHAPTIAQLEQGILFIQHVIEGGGKVYIHCRGGIGRAPTMATAYLLYKGFELEDAITFIRESRPFIKIMPAQMQRLKELQATIRDKKTMGSS